MSKPRALDLFCGAGGASMGLHRAGFDVTGVDWNDQPRYPLKFRIANALAYPLEGFDFIWASPPCQKYTAMKTMPNAKKDHPDLVDPIRQRLIDSGVPYVIENVPGSPLLAGSIMLCGTMFDLRVQSANAELRRHRWFEASFHILTPSCQHEAGRVCGVYGGHGRDRRPVIPVYSHGDGGPNARIAHRKRTVNVYGHAGGRSRRDGTQMFNTKQRKEAMGIDWMKDYELSQAIPPAFGEFIGRQAIEYLKRAA